MQQLPVAEQNQIQPEKKGGLFSGVFGAFRGKAAGNQLQVPKAGGMMSM